LIWFLVFNATFNYIMATSFSGGRSRRTTDHGQATGKLYHLQLRVECTLFCKTTETHSMISNYVNLEVLWIK
jgi:hypothetical protein